MQKNLLGIEVMQLFIFVLIMITLTGLKIFIADIAANYCCRASVTTRDTKHSSIAFVCVLSDILL